MAIIIASEIVEVGYNKEKAAVTMIKADKGLTNALNILNKLRFYI